MCSIWKSMGHLLMTGLATLFITRVTPTRPFKGIFGKVRKL